MHRSLMNFSRAALLAGAAALALAALPASAQDYGPYNGPPDDYGNAPPPDYAGAPPDDYANAPPPDAYAAGPGEEVIVTAPHFRQETAPLNAPLEKVSLSTRVTYGDLDLATRGGAHELRARVRDAARDVCAQLADAYPVYQLNGTSCLKDAMQNGLVRANAAITTARQNAREDYDEGYED